MPQVLHRDIGKEGGRVRRSERTKLPNTLLDPGTWDLDIVGMSSDKNLQLLHHLKIVVDLLAAKVAGQHRGGGDK